MIAIFGRAAVVGNRVTRGWLYQCCDEVSWPSDPDMGPITDNPQFIFPSARVAAIKLEANNVFQE